jgi:glycolate oxidase FAD binding subunit
MHTPDTIEQLQEIVRREPHLCAAGGGSKPNLSARANLSLSRLSGVLQYDPGEYTFTALAGTPIAEIISTLAAKGQYLAFDPPLASQGATLGGTVAAGLSGPGSLRHGTIRDFILGVRFVTGAGDAVFGGGKVVKNAAGFDFPKLMVGALGQLGVLVEMTFKVFPLPEQVATLEARYPSRTQAVAAMRRLAVSQVEPGCLDIAPLTGEDEPAAAEDAWAQAPHRLLVRLTGTRTGVPSRLDRAQTLLQNPSGTASEIDDHAAWEEARGFGWVPRDCRLVKVGAPLDKLLAVIDALPVATYRLSVAGHVLWLAWPRLQPVTLLEEQLQSLRIAGLVISGEEVPAWIGHVPGGEFFRRIRSSLDPRDVLLRKVAVDVA